MNTTSLPVMPPFLKVLSFMNNLTNGGVVSNETLSSASPTKATSIMKFSPKKKTSRAAASTRNSSCSSSR